MTRLSDAELVSTVTREFDNAIGADGSEISRERAQAWRFFNREPLGNEVEGRSQVVTSDVADTVEGIMPSLLRLFTTKENLLMFDPVGPEDVAQAEQESDFVNHVFFKRNPAFMILYTWFFDAILQKNGIVKAWWDTQERVTTEEYTGLTEAEVLELLMDDELEPIERSEREGETVDPQTQQVVTQQLIDIKFRRTEKAGRVRVENVPPEEYRISSDARVLDPSPARFVGQERAITRSGLIAMGFDRDTVMSLPTISSGFHSRDSEEKIARRNTSDEQTSGEPTELEEEVLLQEAYIRIDDDDGRRSELYQVMLGGGELLSSEPIDRQPFHVISPIPLPHKHTGMSLADRTMDVQEVTTVLMRNILDNVYQTNQPGHGIYEQGIGDHTLDDLLVTEIGSIKRFARPPQEAYMPITVPFTAGQTFPIFQFWNDLRRTRTGVSDDAEGIDVDALKNVQQSVLMQASDMQRAKIEAIARIFSETGIRTLFLHIHELIAKHQQKAEVVRLRNEWVEVDPTRWRTRFDTTVTIGLGIGSREQNLLHLDAIWQKQTEMAQGGGMNLTVTPRNFFNTAAEFVRNANLKEPELFFTDPGDQQSPPPNQEQIQLQQQAQQLEAQRQAQEQRQQELREREVALREERERQQMQLEHMRELEKLSVQRQSNEDRMLVEMEKIRNQLTQLELEFNQNVPGART